MTDGIRVPFAGERSGTFDLSWGQRDSWVMMAKTGVSMCVGGIEELPPGVTVADVVATTRYVLHRHEALRSRLRFDANDRPYQELFATGEFVVELIDAGAEDPAEVAASVLFRIRDVVFDYENEWPVRMAIITRDGVLTHAVAAYNHLASDGPGLLAVDRDLAHLLPGPDGAGSQPPAGTQPMDQVRQQASPAGQRQNATALRHWERQLRRIPARRLVGSTDHRSPRFWEVAFASRAMFLAAHVIADRDEVGTSPVLLAALSVAMGRYTGDSPFAAQVMVSNRFRPGFAESVSPLSQGSICVVDTADTTFDEVVHQADRAAMQAYLNAYYDPFHLDDVIAAVSRERGEDIDVSCFFNDRRFRFQRQDVDLTAVDRAGLRALVPDSTFDVLHKMDRFNDKIFVHVDDVPDVIRLFVCVDTHHISPGDTEALLRSMEDILVDAACTADLPTDVRPRIPAG